ncbi:MAG: aminoglycoside phosphotransferase family protein [Bacteroidales bacterium]|nr:aminoglycoside phosphotransferase family protein [Bacteroidales bacterium]
MNEDKTVRLFEDSLNETIIKIVDKSKGAEQLVKIIETTKGKYILKMPREKVQVFREIFACENLKNLPVPKIFYKHKDFVVEEYMEGIDLDEVKLSPKQEKEIYCQMGNILSNIHKTRTEGFGFIGLNGKGEYLSLKEKIYKEFQESLNFFKKGNFLSLEEIEKAKEYFNKNESFLDSTESVLLHFDYEDWNIRINDGRVAGIIDFGDLSAGPKAYDLARPFISYYGSRKFDYFMEGYGKANMEEVKYYAFLSLLWMVIYHYLLGDTNFKEKLKILRSIIY